MKRIIHLAHRDIVYRVRYSRKARRVLLRISREQGLEVVLPHQAIAVDLEGILRRKAAWILKKLDQASRAPQGTPFLPVHSGTKVPLMGREVMLHVLEVPVCRASVSWTEAGILIKTASADEDHVRRLLRAWYRRAASVLIPRRVQELNASRRFAYTRIMVRNQRTRWGSCSRRGTLSFNWRLVLLPQPVMDYLILHELAHLKQMNHSRRFWKLVETLSPGYRTAERWLKNMAPGEIL